jgi:hypothetical protein
VAQLREMTTAVVLEARRSYRALVLEHKTVVLRGEDPWPDRHQTRTMIMGPLVNRTFT